MAIIKNIISGSIDGIVITGSLDVSGGITGSLFGTASFASNTPAIFPFSGSAIIIGDLAITGSILSTQGFTGSLQGTSSWANNATTASYILNAISSSFATSASQAVTASYVLQAVSASFATSASQATTASYILNAESSSFATTASFASNGGVTQIIAGTNVTISPTSGLGAVTINSTATGGGGGNITVADEGLTQGTASYFDFTGAGVTATVSNNTASISIPGGGGSSNGYLNTSFDGLGSVILINTLDYYRVPKAGTITEWSVLANGTFPTMSFDVWVTGSDGSLPNSSNSICGGNFPFISGSRNAITSSTLTNWTTSFTADSIFAVNVRSSSIATRASLLLYVNWA